MRNRRRLIQVHVHIDDDVRPPESVGTVRCRWHLTAVNEFIWRNQQFSVSAFATAAETETLTETWAETETQVEATDEFDASFAAHVQLNVN